MQLQMHKIIWIQKQKGCKMDIEAIKHHIKGLLIALGEDPEREGLKETPIE